ncbi:MAG TPA: AGE family epimerase/isomerase [Vicinamibacteria bacterium]|nr:AGE family epimerase/isomerase [Vicinamibacteria bacterium]
MSLASRLGALRDAMEKDLRENVLPFWIREAVDEQHGGFRGYVSDEGVASPLAPKGAVLCARILWAYSAALRRTGDDAHRRMADRAFAYLRGRFLDPEHGGTYWMLDHAGRPLADRKQTYALAFGLYGLAEYRRATGSAQALEHAIGLYRSIEAHAWDGAHGGYWEARARDWGRLEDVRLSDKDLNAPKSMNTNLHVAEAYANLLRVWDDPGLRERLRALVSLHLDRIVDPSSGHLVLFFDERWQGLSCTVSFGHDIEASWLLVDAAQAAGGEALLQRARATARRVARVTLAEGVDPEHGGLFAERREDWRLDDEKHWWMQAEAVVGFLNAYELTGEEPYLTAAERTWAFVEHFLIDRVHGEWRWRVRRDGTPIPGLPKIEPWKCPYHNSRAAFEVADRVARLSS